MAAAVPGRLLTAYANDWFDIKKKYSLTATVEEAAALRDGLASCSTVDHAPMPEKQQNENRGISSARIEEINHLVRKKAHYDKHQAKE